MSCAMKSFVIARPVNFLLLLLISEHGVDASRSHTRVKIKKDDALCKLQSGLLVDGYHDKQLWAMKVFDSWGKSQSGLFSGNLINFGHYEQCLQMSYTFENASHGNFQGQHCIVFFRDAPELKNVTTDTVNLLLPPTTHIELMRQYMNFFKVIGGTALCVPSFCTAAMVKQIADGMLSASSMITTDNYEQEHFCNTINILEMRPIDMFAALFFSFMLLLLVLSTAYDLTMRKYNYKQKPIFAAFSVYTNGLKLFETGSSSGEQIDCIHGIRALSILGVIHGHRLQTYIMFPIINMVQFREQWFTSWAATFTLATPMAINTFFLLSGLLTTRSILKRLDRHRKINIGYLYIHRYLRITPVVGATIFCFMSLQRYFGDGPFNKFLIDLYYANCEKYWYTALLHIQNFVNPNDTCMNHTWYLSPDFQMFLLAPLLVYPLWKFGKYFIAVPPLLCLASTGFILYISNEHGFHVLPNYNTLDGLHLYNRYVYEPFYSRACPYLFGMMTAYLLFKKRDEGFDIKKYLNVGMWFASAVVMLSIVVGMLPFQSKHDSPPRLIHSIYSAGSQLGWSVANSWIIISCHCGYGGLVNSFLSLPIWKPLSRIGLSIYVTHVLAILAIFGTQKEPAYFNDFLATHLSIGDVGLSFGVAVLAFLTFEASFMAIEQSFYPQKKREKKLTFNVSSQFREEKIIS